MEAAATPEKLKDPAWRAAVGFDSIMSCEELQTERRRLDVESLLEESRGKRG